MGGPKMVDVNLLLQAGINPKNGLPVKFGGNGLDLKTEIKKQLRILDEQDAVNRYIWYNLPCDITSQELERMLYYKGQLAFFYSEVEDKFYFMPYALDGTIDFYGRYNTIHPVPMSSGVEEEKTKSYKNLADLLSTMKFNPVYGVKNPELLNWDDLTKSCVLVHDYTKQLSQTVIARQIVNDGLLDAMADCIPYMSTALLLATGIEGVRVTDADQMQSIEEANKTMKRAALEGKGYVPIEGALEFQELNKGSVGKSEEYMLAMQSLDNYRLSLYGIDNGGLFQKKAHELQSEADINGGPVGLVLQDGLSIRQNFCNIVNSIWNLGIWCEPAQNIIGADTDGDGLSYDRDTEGSNTGIENEGGTDDGNYASI